MEKKIKIYTRKHCSKCEQAKALLSRFNHDYDELNIDVFKEYLCEVYPSLKELPVVFINNVLIGGLKELTEYIEHERLEI